MKLCRNCSANAQSFELTLCGLELWQNICFLTLKSHSQSQSQASPALEGQVRDVSNLEYAWDLNSNSDRDFESQSQTST